MQLFSSVLQSFWKLHVAYVNFQLTLTFSLKDTSLTRWLNVDWIKDQYKKDLDGVVLYHSLHDKLQDVTEWHGPYVAHLFHTVPGTWDEFKEIKFNYMKNEKNDFDEDLFTVCLIYHQIFRSTFWMRCMIWYNNVL